MRISDWSSDVCSSDLFFLKALPAGRGITSGRRNWPMMKNKGKYTFIILPATRKPVVCPVPLPAPTALKGLTGIMVRLSLRNLVLSMHSKHVTKRENYTFSGRQMATAADNPLRCGKNGRAECRERGC